MSTEAPKPQNKPPVTIRIGDARLAEAKSFSSKDKTKLYHKTVFTYDGGTAETFCTPERVEQLKPHIGKRFDVEFAAESASGGGYRPQEIVSISPTAKAA